MTCCKGVVALAGLRLAYVAGSRLRIVSRRKRVGQSLRFGSAWAVVANPKFRIDSGWAAIADPRVRIDLHYADIANRRLRIELGNYWAMVAANPRLLTDYPLIC